MTTQLDKVSEDAERELLKAEDALLAHIDNLKRRDQITDAARANLTAKYPALRK